MGSGFLRYSEYNNYTSSSSSMEALWKCEAYMLHNQPPRICLCVGVRGLGLLKTMVEISCRGVRVLSMVHWWKKDIWKCSVFGIEDWYLMLSQNHYLNLLHSKFIQTFWPLCTTFILHRLHKRNFRITKTY